MALFLCSVTTVGILGQFRGHRCLYGVCLFMTKLFSTNGWINKQRIEKQKTVQFYEVSAPRLYSLRNWRSYSPVSQSAEIWRLILSSCVWFQVKDKVPTTDCVLKEWTIDNEWPSG